MHVFRTHLWQSQRQAAGLEDVDEAALDAELTMLRGSIADVRRGLAAGRAELRVMDRDLAAAGVTRDGQSLRRLSGGSTVPEGDLPHVQRAYSCAGAF